MTGVQTCALPISAFHSFAAPAWQAAHPEAGRIEVVDATGTPDDVGARVMRAVSSVPGLAWGGAA